MDHSRLIHAIFGGDELGSLPAKGLSFALLATALALAWLPHETTAYYFWSASVSFLPDFISGMLALAVTVPLYARRIIPYPHHSLNGILFLLVNLALTATVIQIALGQGSGIGTLPAVVVLSVAIALSWLGMRAAASLAWVALLGFSVLSVILTNYAWGMAGFGFVACGFSGLLLQTPLNPSALFSEIVREYGPAKVLESGHYSEAS